MLEERDRKLTWLRAELAKGQELEKRGELIDFTLERLETIKRQAIVNVRAGKPVKGAVRLYALVPRRKSTGLIEAEQ